MTEEENNRKIQIKHLDLNNLRPTGDVEKDLKGGAKFVIIGRSGSGKSWLIRDIIKSKRHLIPVGVVISESEMDNKFYETFFPKSFIHDEYSSTILEKITQRYTIAKGNIVNPRCLLIMDDCMGDTKKLKCSSVEKFFKQSRHSHVFSFIACQYVYDLSPPMRCNIEGVFLFKDTLEKNKKKIWTDFGSVIPDYHDFCDIFEELTEDYGCMFIDYTNPSNKIEECVFHYKAKNIENFKFGCKEYIDFEKNQEENIIVK